ncbi:MAG TPA: helix-turn-helix domain-containing protein [Jatrophihabitans sp.]|nr:helix-turn-helix domain-containing protein [Jatrophihabitans sp.]
MARRDDPTLAALEKLLAALDETEADMKVVRTRAAFIKQQRAAGSSWTDLVYGEQQPLIVKLLGNIHDRLNTVGVEWRRREAAALHDEGMPMDEIAVLFGVSRQRISTLLRKP